MSNVRSIESSIGNISITNSDMNRVNFGNHSMKQVPGGQGTCVGIHSMTSLDIPQKTFSDYHITVAHSAGV